MKFRKSFFAVIFLFSVSVEFSQQTAQPTFVIPNQSVENISQDLSKIAKSVEDLNKLMKKFFETFSSNQGLKLSEKQSRILFAFEILNRAEQRIANLQTLKLTFSERQTSIRLLLARITDDLLLQSIDRYVSLRGTTNADQLREIRRQALQKEKNELTNLLNGLQKDINEISEEIRQTESFLIKIRQRLFGEIDRELSDLWEFANCGKLAKL